MILTRWRNWWASFFQPRRFFWARHVSFFFYYWLLGVENKINWSNDMEINNSRPHVSISLLFEFIQGKNCPLQSNWSRRCWVAHAHTNKRHTTHAIQMFGVRDCSQVVYVSRDRCSTALTTTTTKNNWTSFVAAPAGIFGRFDSIDLNCNNWILLVRIGSSVLVANWLAISLLSVPERPPLGRYR